MRKSRGKNNEAFLLYIGAIHGKEKKGTKRNESPWLLFIIGMIHVPVNIKKKGRLSYIGRIFPPLSLT